MPAHFRFTSAFLEEVKTSIGLPLHLHQVAARQW
jgi:hypothetical protein